MGVYFADTASAFFYGLNYVYGDARVPPALLWGAPAPQTPVGGCRPQNPPATAGVGGVGGGGWGMQQPSNRGEGGWEGSRPVLKGGRSQACDLLGVLK